MAEKRHAGGARLIAVNKPFDMLCQFSQGTTPPAGASAPRRTLAELALPAGLYPAGRLDRDSEGLLLLTDHGALQHRLSDPAHQLVKRYRVQVEGCPEDQTLQRLRDGIVLKDGRASALQVDTIDEPEPWPRDPPIRVRRSVPTTWLELSIDEGRNRQVRRMTAAVGHPTLRLVRMAIGPFELEGLSPGQWQDVDAARLPRRATPPARRRPPASTRRRQWPRSTE